MKPCDICEKFQLRIDKQLTGGNNCASVFLCSMFSGKKVVLKYADSAREKKEVLLNIVGYQKMREGMGLDFFIPKLYGYSADSAEPYVLLEYCGPDFQSLLLSGTCSVSLTEPLLEVARRVFRKSLAVGQDGQKSVNELLQKMNKLVEDFVLPHFNLSSYFGRKLRNLPGQFRNLPEKYTFASWDFTPNNLCRSSDVRFIDPRGEVTGNPIPGLACYAGILRDVHQFRNAGFAYDMIHSFATSELAEILGMTRELAEQCFLLGRLFQSLMGVRFRVRKSLSEAEPFLLKAEEYLSQIL